MITLDKLKEILEYNKETGKFTWKVSVKGSKGKGKVAGTVTNKGYIDICIKGKKYGAHRLAMLFANGEIPSCVDHINGVKSDNRLENLRPATHSENGYNYKGTGSNTGYKNVYFDARGKKHFFIAIVTNGVRKSYGYFDTAEEASKVATQLRNELHKKFANHG